MEGKVMVVFQEVGELPKDTQHWVVANAKKKHPPILSKATHVWLIDDLIKGFICIEKDPGYSGKIAYSSCGEVITEEVTEQIHGFILETLRKE